MCFLLDIYSKKILFFGLEMLEGHLEFLVLEEDRLGHLEY